MRSPTLSPEELLADALGGDRLARVAMPLGLEQGIALHFLLQESGQLGAGKL